MQCDNDIDSSCHQKIKTSLYFVLFYLFGLGLFSHTIFEVKNRLFLHYLAPVFLIALLWDNRLKLRRILWPLTFELPLIFLILYSLLSLLWVETPVVNFYSLKGMVFGLLCLFIAKLCTETFSNKAIVKWLLVFWFLNILFIVLQLNFTGEEMGAFLNRYAPPLADAMNDRFLSSDSYRVTGFSLNQNRTTYNLVAIFLFVVFQIKNLKLLLFWMTLNAFALFTLGSRSAFLTFILLSIIFLGLTFRSRKFNRKIVITATATFLLLISVFYSGIVDKFIDSPSNSGRISNFTFSVIEDYLLGRVPKETSAAIKLQDFNIALIANKEHPFFGVGYDGFTHFANTYEKYKGERPYIRMHNLPHRLLTEYGLIGFGILSFLFFWILPKKLLSHSLFQLVAFVLTSLASAWPFQVFTFWVILGIKKEKELE